MAGFGNVWEGLKSLGGLGKFWEFLGGLEGLGPFETVWKGLGEFDKVRKGFGRSGRAWVGPRRAVDLPLGRAALHQ